MGPGRQDFLYRPGPAFQRFAETRSHHEVMIRKGLGVSQQAISAEAEMCSQGQSWPREHCLPICETLKYGYALTVVKKIRLMNFLRENYANHL